MSYMQDFEKELRTQIEGSTSTDALVRWICEKMLASYRNGIRAGQNGEQVKRSGESRRRGSYGKAE